MPSRKPNNPDQPGQPGRSAQKTTDHDQIRHWVEAHGGHPACVRGPADPEDVGTLRIEFAGLDAEPSLREISWDEFFDKFEEKKLALLYREKDGFNKLVARDSHDE